MSKRWIQIATVTVISFWRFWVHDLLPIVVVTLMKRSNPMPMVIGFSFWWIPVFDLWPIAVVTLMKRPIPMPTVIGFSFWRIADYHC